MNDHTSETAADQTAETDDLRRKLAVAERIRENADFHLGQEMARRQTAEKETVQLRAVVARVGQMADAWEERLPEVIRTPAVVSALRAALEPAAVSAVRPPATDRTALRERAAEAIRSATCPGDCGKAEEECARERIQPFVWHHGRLAVVEGEPEMFADAVLAVWPAPADRAAVLREAADGFDRHAEQILDGSDDKAAFVAKALREQAAVWQEAAETLRRMAAEPAAAGPDQTQPGATSCRCGHSKDRHMGDEHERGCHVCWDSPGNSGWNHPFTPDRPQPAAAPAVGGAQQPKETRP